MLIISDDFKPNSGGIAEMLDNLANEWSRQKHNTYILTPQLANNNELYKRIATYNLTDRLQYNGGGMIAWLIWKAKRYLLRKSAHFPKNFLRKKYYLNLLKPHEFNQVIVGVWSPRTSQILDDIRSLQLQTSIIVHGAELLVYGKSNGYKLRKDLKQYKIFANSEYTRKITIDLGINPSQVSKFSMGVRNLQEKLENLSKEDRNALQFIVGKKYIFSISSLVERKGIDKVIESLSLNKENLQDLVYVVAGDGPNRISLEHLAESIGLKMRIIFLGKISDELKCHLFRNCLFYVMPSRITRDSFEGFGIVYLEAALFKKAVIGSNVGGALDAIEDGVTGILIDPNSQKELSQAIILLYEQKKYRNKLGEAAYDNVISNHMWEGCAKDLLNSLSGPSVRKLV